MFTPVETTLGAGLLHLATTTLLFDSGAILGASGLLRRLFAAPRKGNASALWFFSGMAAAVGVVSLSMPGLIPEYAGVSLQISSTLGVVLAGFLAGWGTKVTKATP